MSRFYANIQGNRGEATRTGTAKSGMTGHIRGWDLGCRVIMLANGDDDVCSIWLTSGSKGQYGGRLLGIFRQEDVANPAPSRDDVSAELLAALEGMLSCRCSVDDVPVDQCCPHWAAAEAAIAKAKKNG